VSLSRTSSCDAERWALCDGPIDRSPHPRALMCTYEREIRPTVENRLSGAHASLSSRFAQVQAALNKPRAIAKSPLLDQVRSCIAKSLLRLLHLLANRQVRIKKLNDMCYKTEADTEDVLKSVAQNEIEGAGVYHRSVHQGADESKSYVCMRCVRHC
jgi:hypothetical protein